MLELVIRNLYVDAVFASRETPLDVRMTCVEHQLKQKDVELLKDIPWRLVSDARLVQQRTRTLYGELSSYAHPSHEQLAKRLDEADRGVYSGLETSVQLAEFNDLVERAYDVILVYAFEALGPMSTGDVFIHVIEHGSRFGLLITSRAS